MKQYENIKDCLKERDFLKSKEDVLYKDFMTLFSYLFFLVLTVGVVFTAFHFALIQNSILFFFIFLSFGIGLFVFCLLVLISDDIKIVVSRNSYLEKKLSNEDLVDLSMINIKFMDAPLKEIKDLYKKELKRIDDLFLDEENLKIFHQLLLEDNGLKMKCFSYFKERIEAYEESMRSMKTEVDAVNEYLEKKGMETFNNNSELNLKIEENQHE